jgi:NAD(P)-dependent dehydrogenase (short-subunit alcohol dehydrogenase family)
MTERLMGKVAVVTGAARNGSIGRAIALELAREGADVAINDFERAQEAESLRREIESLGRRSMVVLADIRRVDECRRVVSETVDFFGALDILVNNAGFAQHKCFEEITEADYEATLELHLKGPFFLSQAAVPHLRKSAGGKIINISSEQAYIGYPDLAHYTAAKAGLQALTKSLALALAPGITVNTIAPGPTATERFKAGVEYTDSVRDKIPLKRWGTPHDVARSVAFLVSSDGEAFTGQTLDPNCGTVMH